MSGCCPFGDRLLHPLAPRDRLLGVVRVADVRDWYSAVRLTTSPALVTIPILYVRPLSAFGW